MFTELLNVIRKTMIKIFFLQAIDIWIGVCLAFIFGALLEFALVNWAARQDLIVATYRNRHQAYFLMRQ
uniref:Uncharacterized protein n=1 Tax=Parascaris equorum TaxID=6256 RepID=A0A914S536_PAREQ